MLTVNQKIKRDAKIYELYLKGLTVREIGKLVNLSHTAVHNIVKDKMFGPVDVESLEIKTRVGMGRGKKK